MKIVIISDSHGNIANLKHVLGFARKIDVGAIIHCGDWDNLRAVETVVTSGIPIYGVLGNGDIDPRITNNLELITKNFNEKFLTIEIEGRKIGVIHDVLQLDSFAAGQLDILFVGHTHKQGESVVDGVKVVNPGALEHNASFAVYDTVVNRIEFLDA